MSSDFQRVEAVYNAASEIASPAERAAYLLRECAGNDALRQRVEEMLALESVAQGFFQNEQGAASPINPEDPSQPAVESIGDMIGPYRLVEILGEGGFGAVYVAEQTSPVRRRVALKVIKPGMDTKEVIARFNTERQALALMNHPNIARVLEAGATARGRPYFVMELVPGIRITDYCDQERLTIQKRLALFIEVCRAVQHAHQKGIIHRDLKPSNILVVVQEGVAVPKIIDFGIAKAAEGGLREGTVVTQPLQLIGTPAYMSPEQADLTGANVDTRADIYSLGVLLYELLAGATPFDSRELLASGFDAMRRTIRLVEPLRPSTRLRAVKGLDPGTAAERRSVEVPRLIHEIRGDLDWIVMKCLEKDRARRYETANGLAADLQRHLNDEPVVARPPNTFDRCQKAWRRNRLAFAAAGAVLLALVAGIVVSTWLMLQSRQAQGQAEAAQREAEAARQREADQRLLARRSLYASDVRLAQQACTQGEFSQARVLLDRHRPTPGEKDLRGWEWRFLWQQCRSDSLFTLCRKPSEIRSLDLSPDGRRLAVQIAEDEGTAIWDLETRRETGNLRPPRHWPPGYARGMAYSPDGTLFAYAQDHPSADATTGTVALREVATEKTLGELPVPGRCARLFFSADGKRLLAYSRFGRQQDYLGTVTLWDLAGRKQVAQFPARAFVGIESPILAVTSDLGTVAYCRGVGEDTDMKRTRVLDLATGLERLTDLEENQVKSLAFSPDGTVLAVGLGDPGSTIRLREFPSLKLIGELQGHQMWINAMVFWPDGKTLASASADGTIRLWDVPHRRPLGPPLRGHDSQVWQLALVPGQNRLISGGSGGAVIVWDCTAALAAGAEAQPREPLAHGRFRPDKATPRTNESFYGRAAGWHFTPDSQAMFTCNMAGSVRRWSGPEFSQATPWLEVGPEIHPVAFSTDCRWLATGSYSNGNIAVWDLNARRLHRQLKVPPARLFAERFLGEEKRLALYEVYADTMHEWDLTTGAELRSWSWEGPNAPGRQRPFAFSADEHWCLILGWGGHARLRDLATGVERSFPIDVRRPVAAAFSPDGKFFAAGNRRDFATLWTMNPLKEAVVFRGFTQVNAVTFSPENDRLVIASRMGKALTICDVQAGQPLLTLDLGNYSILPPVAFSPDGNVLAGVDDQLDRVIWRAPSWAEIEAAEQAQMK